MSTFFCVLTCYNRFGNLSVQVNMLRCPQENFHSRFQNPIFQDIVYGRSKGPSLRITRESKSHSTISIIYNIFVYHKYSSTTEHKNHLRFQNPIFLNICFYWSKGLLFGATHLSQKSIYQIFIMMKVREYHSNQPDIVFPTLFQLRGEDLKATISVYNLWFQPLKNEDVAARALYIDQCIWKWAPRFVSAQKKKKKMKKKKKKKT